MNSAASEAFQQGMAALAKQGGGYPTIVITSVLEAEGLPWTGYAQYIPNTISPDAAASIIASIRLHLDKVATRWAAQVGISDTEMFTKIAESMNRTRQHGESFRRDI